MSERHQQRHQRLSRSECQQRRVSTQLNLIANQLREVNQDFLNLARSQLEAFNELQQSHQSAQPSLHSRSRSPPPSCPHPPSQHFHSQSPPPYTNYRRRTPPASAAHPRTPPTPYCPITPQEPLTEDSGTLLDAPNRSPTPSVLGWDTQLTAVDCSPDPVHEIHGLDRLLLCSPSKWLDGTRS